MSDPGGEPAAPVRPTVDDGVNVWLAGLSDLVAELVDRWELSLGDPLPASHVGYVVTATRSATEPVVLKITVPDGWFPEEVAALAVWDGTGAVDLIDHDPRGAMLLERAVPGTSLRHERDDDRAMRVAADVLEQLWSPSPPGITTVVEEAGAWGETFRDRNRALGDPVPRAVADAAVSLLEELVATPREGLLLHGDLHLGHVLAAEREPWLAVDPRPLVGDREFDVSALLRDDEEDLLSGPGGEVRLRRRFDLLSERLSCDRERLRGWTVAVAAVGALGPFEEGHPDLGRRLVALAEAARSLSP